MGGSVRATVRDREAVAQQTRRRLQVPLGLGAHEVHGEDPALVLELDDDRPLRRGHQPGAVVVGLVPVAHGRVVAAQRELEPVGVLVGDDQPLDVEDGLAVRVELEDHLAQEGEALGELRGEEEVELSQREVVPAVVALAPDEARLGLVVDVAEAANREVRVVGVVLAALGLDPGLALRLALGLERLHPALERLELAGVVGRRFGVARQGQEQRQQRARTASPMPARASEWTFRLAAPPHPLAHPPGRNVGEIAGKAPPAPRGGGCGHRAPRFP